MTKKDYIIIADAINSSELKDRTSNCNNKVICYEHFVLYLCKLLAKDNPRFDVPRFMKACNL